MNNLKKLIPLVVLSILLNSCSILEKTSMHGFNSGYYKFRSEQTPVNEVYLSISGEMINIYPLSGNQPDTLFMSVPLTPAENIFENRYLFSKKSLDIDITTILFKYRPAVHDLPAQMTTDFNVAIYAGWRHDNYHVKSKMDPMGIYHTEVINRGYDFGIFAGPGTTLISPFTTKNVSVDEYGGFILQFGLAGFIESNVASFGIAAGFDYLFSPDREIWIYNNQPWMGFIVGIALN